jgi:tryptophan synthase alpha chain
MANRIDRVFRQRRALHQKSLIGYLTAGFPTRASFEKLVPLMEEAGMDLLEIGVPFSDPVADGPTIQKSSDIALSNGVTVRWILARIATLRRKGCRIPLLLMSYSNPIVSMGLPQFFKAARAAGVDGLIVPDLIPEEGGPFLRAARKVGVYLIFMAAPTTPMARVKKIAARTRGFLYAVSLTGVTGARRNLPVQLPPFLKAIRRVTSKPIAVGFGISTPRQAQAVARWADGVIVGSALIRAVEASQHSRFAGAARFVRSLALVLHSRKESSYAS